MIQRKKSSQNGPAPKTEGQNSGQALNNLKSKTQNPKSPGWWQSGIIYQVYPRSFQDSNGDGVGDLPGITSRLGYLKWLGVDAIWISPIYPSPMADFGYDISNYTDIEPLFGTLDDFDRLVAEAHKHGLKVILDLVPNHTSDRHPWFVASRSSRDDERHDWYVWADAAPQGGPPNNWLSVFGGSAWEWDEDTGQYYLHSFLKEQPDLNWRNPAVKDAMLGVMRFWLDKGVDGFRVDVIDRLVKDEYLRDDPPNPDWNPAMEPYKAYLHIYSMNRPELHDILREMRALLDSYDDRVLIGESYLPLESLVKLYGERGDEACMPFNFELIRAPWDADHISSYIERYEKALPDGGWPNWVLGNHDKHRIASRVGREEARVAQMLLLTLRGTPTCYYGDEIGMADVDIAEERVQDPWGRNVPGLGLGRDPERTPMQWDSSEHAGFSSVEPWLPVGADYRDVNVEAEREDPNSMLSFFRALVDVRRTSAALSVGSYSGICVGGKVLAYVREHDGERVLIVLNFSDEPALLDLSTCGESASVLLSTHADAKDEIALGSLDLRGSEGVILRPSR